MVRWTVHLEGGPKRAYHAAVAVGHKVYSFGGHWESRVQIGVHVFNTVSLKWMKLPPVTSGRGESPSEVPSRRWGHTAVLIADMIYIWGGHDIRECCNVLYAFDVNTHRWFKPKVSGTVPEVRRNHSACVLGKVMYIFGGWNGMTATYSSSDIYKLDTTTAMVWVLINTRGTRAHASSFHSATIIGTKMFIFGGQGEELEDEDENCYNILRVFDTQTNCWLSTPSAQLLPEGRCRHSAFAYNGELYIFGGDSYNWYFNDLWKFNLETFSWKEVEPKGKGPCPMFSMGCCMVGDRILVFGGHRVDFEDLEDEESSSDEDEDSSSDEDCSSSSEECSSLSDEEHSSSSDERSSSSDEESSSDEDEYEYKEVSDDLYILDFSPSLTTLCKLAVIQYSLGQSGLPHDIKWELRAMTTNKSQSQSGMVRWTQHLEGAPKRAYHAVVRVGHTVYSFGGLSYGGAYEIGQKIDVHVFNTVSLRWMKLPLVTTGRGESPLEVPSRCWNHTAVLIEHIIYIWGGVTDIKVCCNMLYAFDINIHRWVKSKVSGTVPEARRNHSACVLGKVMYIFGGWNGLTATYSSNDIYKLDTLTMVWSLIITSGTPAPASLYHSATIIGTKMFVFGGQGVEDEDEDEDHYHNIRVFDTQTNCWLSTPSAQLPPEGRCRHSAFAYNGELYIFGGDNYNWTFNDLWKFNPENFSWKEVEPKGKGPCPTFSMCCCMVGNLVIIFGGCRVDDEDLEDEDGVVISDYLYILDLTPSLKILCKLAVIQYGLEQSRLPNDIKWELTAMTTNSNRNSPLKK